MAIEIEDAALPNAPIHEPHSEMDWGFMADKLLKECEARQCSCGAAHTSNKNYHLSYCDLKGGKR